MRFIATFVAALFALLHFAPAHGAQSAAVLFGGDMMFDRTVRQTMQQRGGDYLFFCIDPTLASADAVVANLEGPITDNPSQSAGSAVGAPDNFVFTFPIATARLLYNHHIRIVNIGNNHILNFGAAGLLSTEQALSQAGVNFFGDPLERRVATVALNGIPFAFINYNQFAHDGEASSTLDEIAAARAAKLLPIVYAHWGVEYATSAPAYVHALAHRFVEAGAAAVIGSHPHVVEEHETYKGAPIYYSLGNFLFDQYWDSAVDHGLLLKVTFDESGATAVQEIPIALNRDRTVCSEKVQ